MRPAAAAYYLDQVAQGQEDYYAGEGEEAGRWVGAGTRLLEWGGEVDGDDFVSLLGGAGVRKPRANGVAGFDLTFRAPKASATAASWPARSSRTTSDLRLALVGGSSATCPTTTRHLGARGPARSECAWRPEGLDGGLRAEFNRSTQSDTVIRTRRKAVG